jgi:hypothetical protein
MYPSPTTLPYKPFYCEENVWHLASHPYFDDASDCKVVFISNSNRQCWFWDQRAARPNQPICWDYHVVLLAGKQIWDQDTTLPFSFDALKYLNLTFAHVGKIEPDWDPVFRLVDRADYLSHFASDRSHMLDQHGNWIQPPPEWPPIGAGRKNNLQSFIDVHDTTFGALFSLAQLREIC